VDIRKLGTIYLNALAEVISTTAALQLHVKSQDNDFSFNEIVGVMSLDGQKKGMLFVSAKAADVRLLCSNMIGAALADVTNDDIDDTMCELVNMTAGSAKVRLSETEYMFSLTQPFVIKGKDMSLVTKPSTDISTGILGSNDITVKLKIVY